MGFLGSLFGGGGNGANFQANSATVYDPSVVAGNAINQSQNTIQQQQNLVNALKQANGIQNQSNVYNQLGNIASGQGPNPAQAMLNQQTGQNVANQAALMASQRGAAANPALIARQAAQQGAATQQQAVGQGATLQAQQALNALGQQSSIAGQQVSNTLGAAQNLTNAAQNQAGQQIGAQESVNQANVSNASQQNNANASIANTNAQGQQGLFGGLTGAAGAALDLLAEGGKVKAPIKYADGGDVDDSSKPSIMQGFMNGYTANSQNNPIAQGFTQFGQGINNAANAIFPASNPIADQAMSSVQANSALLNPNGPQSNYGKMLGVNTQFAKGGKVKALVSPGEIYLPPKEAERVAKHEMSPMRGEHIPGKAKVKGAVNSYDNDTVPRTLKEGGVVIPRSITQRKDAPEAAQKFVEALMTKKRARK